PVDGAQHPWGRAVSHSLLPVAAAIEAGDRLAAGRCVGKVTRMDGTAAFEAERKRLFAIAYRMLGTASDAADVVQEAWLRWQRASNTEIDSPRALLSTVVPRLP